MHRKSPALASAIFAAATAFGLMSLAGTIHPSIASAGCGAGATKAADTKPAVSEAPKLAIGAEAPAFSLTGTDDKVHTMAGYKDAKAVVVVFTCLSCPVARAYEERILTLAREYAPQGVQTVAIMSNDTSIKPDDSTDKLKKRVEEMKYPFVYLVDSTQQVAKDFGAKVTPHVFVFDADRKLAYRGRIDDEADPTKVKNRDLRAALDALVAGKPVTMAETKEFGCSIKWKKEKAS
jgi:peroxiredoxin